MCALGRLVPGLLAHFLPVYPLVDGPGQGVGAGEAEGDVRPALLRWPVVEAGTDAGEGLAVEAKEAVLQGSKEGLEEKKPRKL